VEQLKTQFILTGFSEVGGSRIFAFEGIGADRSRTPYTVGIDLSLIRRYGIRLQDLPLLCRAVLERSDEGEPRRVFTFTEADMCMHADGAAAQKEAAKKNKQPRRPATEHAGAAWRVPSR